MGADGSVVIQITGDDKEFKQSLGTLGGVASGALKGVATAVAAAGAAIAGLATAAAVVGKEFETSLAATSTMFGDVAVDTDGLTTQILALADASGIAAKDISGSLYNALSAGIPVTEDMTGAMDYMESASKLAAAGFTDIDTAVTATAKVMNAYGMGLEDTDMIQKVMLQTQNKGITTVNELGATLAAVTPTAAAMGVSFENVGAALATMTAAGTPTAQATTQLNSLIAELGKNGTTAAKNLTAAAEGTDYAGMSFTDMTNAGVPLNEILDMMGTYADDSGLSMIDLFSSLEAGKAAMSMAGENSGKFADNLLAMGTEADVVSEAYAKVTDTLDFKISKLKTGVADLGIAVYNGMKDPLKETADLAAGWLGEVTKAFSEGGISGAVGAVGNVLAQVVTYIAEKATMMIDMGVQLLGALITGLSDNLPALAAGAVGIVTGLVNGIIELLPELAIMAVQLIAALVEGIADALPELIPAAVGAVMTLVQGLLENIPVLVNAALQLVLGLAKGIVAAIPVLLEALPVLIDSLLEGLLSSIPQIIEAGIELLVALVEALPTIISTIVAVLPQIINSITSALLNNIDKIIDAGITLIVALVENLPLIIKTIVAAIPQIVTGIVNAFISLVGKLVEVGGNLIKGVWRGIKDAGAWLWDKISGFFGGIVDKIKNFFGIHSPSTLFAEIGGYTIEGFAEGFEDGAKDSKKRMLDTANEITDELTDALSGDIVAQFDEQLSAAYQKMQATVDVETGKIGFGAAAQAESKAANSGITREITNTSRTVEKVAQIEGDGLTGDLVRLLGLRLKDDRDRVGDDFEG